MLQTKKISFFFQTVFWIFFLTSMFGVHTCLAQSDFLSSQYMNSQLMINPAYTGVRNSLSINVLSRQQWLGVKDAPTTYLLSAQSPLNKKMASIGGSILNYQSGPFQQNELTMNYSYLLRINSQMFLSLGLSAKLNHYNVGLSSLTVIEGNDPSFTQDVENEFSPNFGAGAFLYSSHFFWGVSVPQILVNKFKNEGIALIQTRSFYLTSGYTFGLGKDFFIKPSFLARFRQESSSVIDANMQLKYKNLFWIGASYRINSSMIALLNIQLSKALGICYSYDFPTNDKTLGVSSHEISLTIDIDKFLKRNRNRLFKKKGKAAKGEDDEKMRSIRYF